MIRVENAQVLRLPSSLFEQSKHLTMSQLSLPPVPLSQQLLTVARLSFRFEQRIIVRNPIREFRVGRLAPGHIRHLWHPNDSRTL